MKRYDYLLVGSGLYSAACSPGMRKTAGQDLPGAGKEESHRRKCLL